MSKTLWLIAHELRLLFADKQALALLFLMPLVFIVFLSLALQDIYLSKVGKKVRFEFVTGNQCETKNSICSNLLEELKRLKYDIELTKVPSLTRPLTLILPANIDSTVAKIKAESVLGPDDKIQLVFDPTLDQSLRALIESNFMVALQSVLIEQVRKEMVGPNGAGGATGDSKLQAVVNVNHFAGLIEEKAIGGVVLPNPIQQSVPAWALFGMFFIVIPMANSMIRDRRLGIFKRLLSFPVYRSQLILGKVLPFFILNIIQFALMFSVGMFLLPKISNIDLVIDFNYWLIISVTAACALAATSYGLMVACLAKTTEQASAFGSLSVVVLAIMGGVMIPTFVMPEFMQKIALLSPLHWGLEAYLDVMVRKADPSLVAQKIFVLCGFGLACLIVARFRFRWSDAE